MSKLPTRAEMFANAIDALNESRSKLGDARDWLNSDWTPDGSSLPDDAADARVNALRKIGKLKNEIDAMKTRLYGGLDEIAMHDR